MLHRDSVSLPVLCRLAMFPWLAAASAFADEPLPGEVDLRESFSSLGLSPKVQGKRGTCSVFAIAGVVEYELCRTSGKSVRLSEEFLNWAKCEVCESKKDGGRFDLLTVGLQVHGICRQDLMPYHKVWDPEVVPAGDALKDAKARTDVTARWIKQYNPTTPLTDGQMHAIKASLAEGHPVAAGLRWPRKLRIGKGAVVDHRRGDEIFDGHSIIFMGYTDDPEQPGGGLVLFRNAWGERWADKGHAYLTYAYVREFTNDALGFRIGESEPLPINSGAAHPIEFEKIGIAGRRKAGGRTQDMKAWCRSLWSGGAQLFCQGEVGGEIVFELPRREPGGYHVNLFATRAPDYGIIRVEAGGRPIGGVIDLHGPAVMPSGRIPLGRVVIGEKAFELTVKVEGKNGESGGFKFGLDCLEMIPEGELFPR
jgi:hypothetical protein